MTHLKEAHAADIVADCATHFPGAQSMLEGAGVKAMLNELSSTVVFERPREEAFVRKWQLACERDVAHVVVMPNVNMAILEEFVTDLIASRTRHFLRAAMKVASDARAACSDDSEED